MTLILLLFLALTAGMSAFPDLPAGGVLRRWLVEEPARALSRFRPGRLIAPALLALIGLTLFLLFEAEGVRLFAMALPEVIGWALTFDAVAALDVLAALLVVGGATRLKPAMDRARQAVAAAGRVFGHARRRAARAVRAAARRMPLPRADDPEPAFA